MRKIIKAVILLPMWPFIWLAADKDAPWDDDLWTCEGRATAMLRWYRK